MFRKIRKKNKGESGNPSMRNGSISDDGLRHSGRNSSTEIFVSPAPIAPQPNHELALFLSKKNKLAEAKIMELVQADPSSIRVLYTIPDPQKESSIFTLLPLAAICTRNPSLGFLQQIHQFHADAISIPDTNGMLPLHLACQYGASLEAIQFLVSKHKDAVTTTNTKGWLPIHLLCRHQPEDLKKMQFMYSQATTTIQTQEPTGCLPLHLSCAYKAPASVVEWWISRYPSALQATQGKQWLPLHMACACQAPLEVVKLLLQKSPSAAKQTEENGGLPLHCACAYRASLEVVEALVKANPQALKTRQHNGYLPLHLACSYKPSLRTIQYLVSWYPSSLVIRSSPEHSTSPGELPVEIAQRKQASTRVISFLEYAATVKNHLKTPEALTRAVLEAKLVTVATHTAGGHVSATSLKAAKKCVHFLEPVLKLTQGIELPSTRIELDAQCRAFEQAIRAAQESDDRKVINQALQARRKLDLLEPVRPLVPSLHQLRSRISQLEKEMQELSDLSKRLELAKEKDALRRRLDMEQRKERELRLTGELLEPTEEEEFKNGGAVPSSSRYDHSVPTNQDSAVNLRNSTNNTSARQTPASYPPKDRNSVLEHGSPTLYVFQSSPLVIPNESTNEHQPIGLLDFESEAVVLKQALRDAAETGAKVEMKFEVATIDGFSGVFARGDCRVLHLSSHGLREFLAIEDGYGGMYRFETEKLERFVKVGGENLELVFVAACHSEAAAQAFLEAGVRHVVCCRWQDALQDQAAIEFARNFYRALAFHHTIKKAFDMARETVRSLPQVMDSSMEADKFLLLPERPVNEAYHEVVVFPRLTRPPLRTEVSDTTLGLRIFPQPPQYFIGRQVDMYKVLAALRRSDIVHLTGPSGIGRASLATGVGRYVVARKSTFLLDDVIWLPVLAGNAGDNGDVLYEGLRKVFTSVIASESTEWIDSQYWHRVTAELQRRRALLLVDARTYESPEFSSRLLFFLGNLLQVAKVKIILIGLGSLGGYSSFSSRRKEVVKVSELDFASSAILFGNLSPFVSGKRCHIVHSATELAELLLFKPLDSSASDKGPKTQRSMLSKRRKLLFDRIGGGNPGNIHAAAVNMTDEKFDELIRIARRPEFEVDSRVALDKIIRDTSSIRDEELRKGNFLQAREHDEALEELESLRFEFPPLEELLPKQEKLQSMLDTFNETKQFDFAVSIQEELKTLEKQIAREMEAKDEAKRVMQHLEKEQEEQKAKVTQINDMWAALANQRVAVTVGVGGHRSLSSVGGISQADSSHDLCFGSCGGVSQVTFRLEQGEFLSISVGSVLECKFNGSNAVVCWTNESCSMDGNDEAKRIAQFGGSQLRTDIDRLPQQRAGRHGSIRCTTGDAVLVGTTVSHPRVILAVGPAHRGPSLDLVLRGCYRACIRAASLAGVENVGFSSFAATFSEGTLNVDECERFLSVWLRTMQERRYSGLRTIHYAASCQEEATALARMASQLGFTIDSIQS